jgi:ribonuclease BN (tRNA processing enzyme)
MDISILGAHNYESSTTSCTCLLIDNTLAIDAGGLTAGLSIQDQRNLHALLITHHHYDHIRDIPGIALNFFRHGAGLQIYSTVAVRDIIETHILNGCIYPKFQRIPEDRPTIVFNAITPLEPQSIDGHSIMAVPVNHSAATIGYQVNDKLGKAMFYTADTGPELSACWREISPQLLIVDVTLSNDCEGFARETGHLTPNLLEHELIDFRECKGYLPQVLAVHMDAVLEPQIKKEIAVVSANLHIPITLAHEGLQIRI